MCVQNTGGTLAMFLLYLCIWKTGASTEGCPEVVLRSVHFAQVHKGTCYLFVDQELYWSDARRACWTLGGEMLSIQDNSTMRFIGNVLNSRQLRWLKQGVWLGARYTGGRWRWTTGVLVDYRNWAPGEPSLILGLFSVEDCALMRRVDNWKWHDYFCASLKFHYNYICEFPFNSVGGHETHTQYTRDNGNMMVLTIILTSGGVVLFILLVVFLAVRRRYNYRKLTSDLDVHFDNSYNLAVRPSAGQLQSSFSTLPPPAHLSASRPPVSNVDRHPAQMEGASCTVLKGLTVCLLKESPPLPGESVSTSLSCSHDDLGACGGGDLGACGGGGLGVEKARVSATSAGVVELRGAAGKMAEGFSGGQGRGSTRKMAEGFSGGQGRGSTRKMAEGSSGTPSQGTDRKHDGDYLLMNGHPLTSAHDGLAVESMDMERGGEERGGGGGGSDGGRKATCHSLWQQ